jgi:hypothetical protein
MTRTSSASVRLSFGGYAEVLAWHRSRKSRSFERGRRGGPENSTSCLGFELKAAELPLKIG